MPWTTPTLAEVRGLVRDSVQAKLPGADALIPNSALRVLSDNQGALCHAVLQYIDWLSRMLLPDTSEGEWLDRHGTLWLKNSDGTTGRKLATLASGTVLFTGTDGVVLPLGSRLTGNGIEYETTADVTIGGGPTEGPIRALDPGAIGNIAPGNFIDLDITGISGVDSQAEVVELTGGVDTEDDNELRARVLQRIQLPPMGGSANDYVAWALAVPGVTRAWVAPNEQGIGTVTVRFLMDDLRVDDDGWPQPTDVAAVGAYLDTVRPVAVKDCFVSAPIKQFLEITIANLVPPTSEVQAAVELSIQDMLTEKAFPGQTIYGAWISYAIMNTPTVQSFRLVTDTDVVMPAPGYMAVLDSILFE